MPEKHDNFLEISSLIHISSGNLAKPLMDTMLKGSPPDDGGSDGYG